MSGPVDPNDDDALAAEYVLRLLDDRAHSAFEARLLEEEPLRRLTYEWERRFAPLADDIAPVAPPQRVKEAIKKSLPQEAVKPKRSLWPWIGAVGLAAAVAFVMFGPVLRSNAPLAPSFEAQLASADGALAFTAGVIPATHEIVIEDLKGSAPPGRVLQLWLIAEGAQGPVSLGLINADGPTRIVVPDAIAPGVRTGTLAVSEEPLGGSPSSGPTGAVLATGTFVDL